MSKKKLKINFKYKDQQKGSKLFESDKNLMEVCQEFASNNGLDFNSLSFMLNRNEIKNFNYYKLLNQVAPDFNEDSLDISVYDINNVNKDYKINFLLESRSTSLECTQDTKMEDICKLFAQQIGKDFNKLIFKYEN